MAYSKIIPSHCVFYYRAYYYLSQSIIEGIDVRKQNLTRIVGIWWVIILFYMVFVAIAQDIAIEVDSPITVTIGESPAWLSYNGNVGEIITLSTLTAITDTAPDTILEILYPDGHRLDYGDDVVLADGTVKSDAVLQDIELPVDGIYRVRIDSFNGVSEGDVEVILQQPVNAYNVITTDVLSIVTGDVVDQLVYTLDVEADRSVSIVARDASNTIDPILWVYTEEGELLAFNDDHQSNDLTLNVLDAKIEDLMIATDRQLTIVVRDYLGREGRVELIISS